MSAEQQLQQKQQQGGDKEEEEDETKAVAHDVAAMSIVCESCKAQPPVDMWGNIAFVESIAVMAQQQVRSAVHKHVANQRRDLGGVFYLLRHHLPYVLHERDAVLFSIEVYGFLAHENVEGYATATKVFDYTNPPFVNYMISDAVTGRMLGVAESRLVATLLNMQHLLHAACRADNTYEEDFTEIPSDRNAYEVHVHVLFGVSRARAMLHAPGLRPIFDAYGKK